MNNNEINGNQLNNDMVNNPNIQNNPVNNTTNNTIKTNFDNYSQSVGNNDYSNNEIELDSSPEGKDYLLAVIARISGKLLYPIALFIIIWLIFGGLTGSNTTYYIVLISLIVVFALLLVITMKFNNNVQKVRNSGINSTVKTVRLIVSAAVLLYVVITMFLGKK